MKSDSPTDETESDSCSVESLPDSLLLYIFSHLMARDLLSCTQVCARWRAVTYDESLWKSLVYRQWNICGSISPGHCSWRSEYKRLYYHAPLIWSETLTEHTDEVLHVSFAHNGSLFATTSKDCTVKVWEVGFPTSLKYSQNFHEVYDWDSTESTCFNASDTMLLVSCVKDMDDYENYCGFIAILSILHDFRILRVVTMNPFLLYGTWLNENTFLSGSMEEKQDGSANVIYIEAFKVTNAPAEQPLPPPVVETDRGNNVFTFRSKTASRIKFLTIAKFLCEETMPTENTDKHVPQGPDKVDPKKEECSPVKCVQTSKGSNSKRPDKTRDSLTPHNLLFVTNDYDEILYKLRIKPTSHNSHILFVEGRKELSLSGVVTGLCISKDHRYLFLNCRPSLGDDDSDESTDDETDNLSSDVEVHVVDLRNLSDTGIRYKGHKGHSQNPFWFLFLDTSEHYIGSGSENSKGYLWDRHYQCCLGTFDHGPGVVNCVGFNPHDEEYFVTVSDDHTIKLWRSRNRQRLNTQTVDR